MGPRRPVAQHGLDMPWQAAARATTFHLAAISGYSPRLQIAASFLGGPSAPYSYCSALSGRVCSLVWVGVGAPQALKWCAAVPCWAPHHLHAGLARRSALCSLASVGSPPVSTMRRAPLSIGQALARARRGPDNSRGSRLSGSPRSLRLSAAAAQPARVTALLIALSASSGPSCYTSTSAPGHWVWYQSQGLPAVGVYRR